MLNWRARTGFIFATVVAVGPLAHAYVRTRAAESNAALRGRNPFVDMKLIHVSAVNTVSTELFNSADNAASLVWGCSSSECTSLSLAVSASTVSDIFVAADRVNSVQFVHGLWGRWAKKTEDRVPYPSSA